MKQKAIKPRSTPGKAIAAAPTFAQKWRAIMDGGKPATELEKIAFEASLFRTPSAHGPEWQAGAEARLKARFADALFPALVYGDKKLFKQLLEFMGAAIRHQGNICDYLLERNKVDTPKKKYRRRLKAILINIAPEDRVSLKAAANFVSKYEPDKLPDESDVWHILQELGLPLLKTGERVQWWAGKKLVRELRVKEKGELDNIGMTREQLEAYSVGRRLRVVELIPVVK